MQQNGDFLYGLWVTLSNLFPLVARDGFLNCCTLPFKLSSAEVQTPSPSHWDNNFDNLAEAVYLVYDKSAVIGLTKQICFCYSIRFFDKPTGTTECMTRLWSCNCSARARQTCIKRRRDGGLTVCKNQIPVSVTVDASFSFHRYRCSRVGG